MSTGNDFPATNDCGRKCTTADRGRPTPTEDRVRLYLLSYLLTADHAKAEQCIAAGLEFTAEDNAAFRDWAHSWARRIVIHDALQLIGPHPEIAACDVDSGEP
jgi:hypothetical protein